jgi:hypothetical protein
MIPTLSPVELHCYIRRMPRFSRFLIIEFFSGGRCTIYSKPFFDLLLPNQQLQPGILLEERVGFEPTDPFRPLVFKTSALNRTLPSLLTKGWYDTNLSQGKGLVLVYERLLQLCCQDLLPLYSDSYLFLRQESNLAP